MNKSIKLLAVTIATAGPTLKAHTTLPPEPPCIVILAPGAAWEYTFQDPSIAQPLWTITSGGWAVGDAPFSNVSGGFFDSNTLWPSDEDEDLDNDLWVRRTVDLSGFDLSSILWDIGIDNGYTLYLNGVPISANNKEGDAHRWDYSGVFPQASLNSGVNYIALALEDHGGGTSFDFQLGSDACVPEAATSGALLAFSFAGMAYFSRRLRS